MGRTRQFHRLSDAPQIIVHHDDIGGFHRGIGAGRAHCHADVGLRESGRVVDTVPGHRGWS